MADALKDAPEMARWLREEAPWALIHLGQGIRSDEAQRELLDRTATAAEMLDALVRALNAPDPLGEALKSGDGAYRP